MKTIRLLDGSFSGQHSASLGGLNKNVKPKYFDWSTNSASKPTGEYTFYTDMRLREAVGKPGKKVAWLIEPPSLSRTHYDTTLEIMEEFDYVLSFWKPYLKAFGDRGLFYPFGGSWIPESYHGKKEKSKNVCIIVSEKKGAEGHRLRHTAVDFYADRLHIDVYGRGYKPFDNKASVLWKYRYAIIIESWTGKDYFSEKLIDAISMGCVPIYHGCPTIKTYFNRSGILTFDNLKTMEHIIISVASGFDYRMRTNAINENIERSKQFQCAEDWMYENYEFLFT